LPCFRQQGREYFGVPAARTRPYLDHRHVGLDAEEQQRVERVTVSVTRAALRRAVFAGQHFFDGRRGRRIARRRRRQPVACVGAAAQAASSADATSKTIVLTRDLIGVSP